MPIDRDPAAPSNAKQWDTEDYNRLLSDVVGHVRHTTMYCTSALWKEMTTAFGGVVTHIKTSTDQETGEVTVFKASGREKGAVKVRLIATGRGVEFSWFRPLRKLGLKVPANRKLNVRPRTEELPGVGTVCIFPMSTAASVPRSNQADTTIPNAVKQAAAGQERPNA